jgi:hypothetical protein
MGFRNRQIRRGDTITITRTVAETKVVKVVDLASYLIKVDGYVPPIGTGGHIRNSEEDCWGAGGSYEAWEVVNIKHAEPEVEHLPCQAGDVWIAKDGREWYVFAIQGVSELRAMTTPHDADKKSNLSIEDFEKAEAKKLVHRKGNR